MKVFNRHLINLITAFLGLWATMLTIGITVRNPLTVVLFVCLFLAKEKMDEFEIASDKKGLLQAVDFIVPVPFAALFTALIYKRASEGFTSTLFKLLTVAILAAGFYCLFFYIVRALELLLFKGRLKKLQKAEDAPAPLKPLDKKGERKLFILVVLICFIFYLPYFLYEFPGIMTADSMVQYSELFADEPISNHHPIIHTVTIGLFLKIGLLFTGSMNTAIAFYTVAQMIFMSLCFGALVVEVNRILGGFSLKITVILTAFAAVVPFNAVFAVTMWKDVPFAGISVLLSCVLIEMYRRRQEGIGTGAFCMFAVLGILFSLYRSNAFYAMIAFAPVFLYTFRKDIRRAAVSMLFVIALTAVIKGPVYGSFGIKSPDLTESLSVPLQQVARVLVEEGSVSQRDLEMIDEVIDRTYIKELYDPGFADNIKELVRAGHPEVIEADKAGYLGLWFRLLVKNSGLYVRAWFDLVGGYIYPDVAYEVGNIDGIIANDNGLYAEPIIGGRFIKVKEILLKLSDFMPLYGMLFSIGAYTWGLVITFVMAIKRKRCVLIHVLMELVVATLLVAAPVVDFRYAYAVVLTAPLFTALAVAKE